MKIIYSVCRSDFIFYKCKKSILKLLKDMEIPEEPNVTSQFLRAYRGWTQATTTVFRFPETKAYSFTSGVGTALMGFRRSRLNVEVYASFDGSFAPKMLMLPLQHCVRIGFLK